MNNSILRDGGFKYYRKRQGAGGKTYWVCSQSGRIKCPAKLITNGGQIISRCYDRPHNHTADAVRKDKVRQKLREGGFTYCRYIQLASGTIYWRCSEFGRMQCPAKVKTLNDQVIFYRPKISHNHNPDGTPKIDTETREAETSTTDAPEPQGSGSQNEVESTSKWRDGGYTFKRNNENTRGPVFWRCCEYWRLECPARLTTNGDQILLRHKEHNHNPDGTPKIDTETHEAGTSTTDVPQPRGSSSQNQTTQVVNQICPKQENVDQICYSPSGYTKPLAAAVSGSVTNTNSEATSSHVSHTTYARRPGQTGADEDEPLDLSLRGRADKC